MLLIYLQSSVEDTPKLFVDRKTLLERGVLTLKHAPPPPAPVQAIITQPEKTLDETVALLDQCRGWLVKYIRLAQSPQWQYSRSPEVFAMFSDLTEEEVVDMVVAWWDERLPEMMMYGKGWNQAAASMFPGVRDQFRQSGNYLHFLKTLSTLITAELLSHLWRDVHKREGFPGPPPLLARQRRLSPKSPVLSLHSDG